MFCRKCGAQLDDNQAFCPNCGASKDASKGSQVVNDVKDQIINSKVVEQVKEKATENGKIKKPVLIAAVISVVAIIVAICLISGYASANAMRKALKANDYYQIQYEYQMAYSNSSKLKKYDSMIGNKIDDLSKDLEKYDFISASQTTDMAVDNWLSSYGSLFGYDEYGSGGYNFANCVSLSNQTKWDEFLDKVISKRNLCYGVYSNAQKDYSAAISSLSQVDEEDSDFEEAENLITECVDSYINAILGEVDSYIAINEIDSALDLLEQSQAYLDSTGIKSTEIQNKIDETLKKYADTYAARAEENFKANEPSAAVGNIQIALELVPNSADYQALKSKYESYVPYELYNEDNVIKSDGDIDFYVTETANNNEEMRNVVSADLYWSDGASCTYNLNGKYDTLTGKIFLSKVRMNQTGTSYFIIYGDGKELYTSPKIVSGFLPKDMSVNVSGVQILEIKFLHTSESDDAYVYLSNLTAQKSMKEAS